MDYKNIEYFKIIKVKDNLKKYLNHPTIGVIISNILLMNNKDNINIIFKEIYTNFNNINKEIIKIQNKINTYLESIENRILNKQQIKKIEPVLIQFNIDIDYSNYKLNSFDEEKYNSLNTFIIQSLIKTKNEYALKLVKLNEEKIIYENIIQQIKWIL